MEQRPQWGALSSFIGDLSKTLAGAEKTRREIAEITGTAWSDDRTIRVVVGPRGQLIDLEIDPRIYRAPNSKALAQSIMSTVQAAVEDANKKTKEIVDQVMPKDHGLGLVDQDALLSSHDADLPRIFKKEDDHGHLS